MHPRTATDGQDVISRIIAGTAAALSRRSGDNSDQQRARADAATAIREFEPQNVIEAMLAGHSVMFHCLLNDAVDRMRATAGPEINVEKVPAGLVALNNAFHRNLDRFERSRKRRAEAGAAASRDIGSGAGQARASAAAPASARATVTPAMPSIPAAPITAPETDAPLPGLPVKLTPKQQLQAAVDALGSGPFAGRPANAIRSGASMNAAFVALAGGVSTTGPNFEVVSKRIDRKSTRLNSS